MLGIVVLAACSSTDLVARQSPSATDLRSVVEFRIANGLRSDADWVRQVASDVSAQAGVRAFGVPLMPDELTALEQRVRAADGVASAVERYGVEQPAEYGGVFIDHARGGIVVAQFTAGVAEHIRALRALVHPRAPLEVRQVSRTLAELAEIERHVRADLGWLESNGVHVEGFGIRPSLNAIQAKVVTDRAGAQALFDERYGARAVVLEIVRATPTPAPGAITGRVVDASGRGVAELEIAPGDPGIDFGEVAILTWSDGSFRVDRAPAGSYRVVASRLTSAGRWEPVGWANVVVSSGETALVNIILENDA